MLETRDARSGKFPSGRSCHQEYGFRSDVMKGIRRLLPGAGVLLAAALLSAQAASPPPADWPMHGRDAGALRFSPLKQITT